jgi:hypothetical protein
LIVFGRHGDQGMVVFWSTIRILLPWAFISTIVLSLV